MKVLQGGCQGPVLIEIRGTRLALGQDLASRILVQAV
jgi:Fe2+ transport system protein FeoA